MLELPYVAGLFDGEGCFAFFRDHKRVVPRVFITNTSRHVLDLLAAQFGGYVIEQKRTKQKWKTCFHFCITNSKAITFMRAIEPWVVIKRDRMLLVEAFEAARIDGWEPELVELLMAESHWTNWRGVGRPELSPSEEIARAS